MNVALSIIVPAYNAERYLRSCIESIQGSTFRNFEIILVDDGSTDGTGALCECLAAEDRRIRVFHTENRKLPGARNFGLRHAAGTYIGFVDADDRVAPDMYRQLLGCMEPDAQMAACRFVRCAPHEIIEPADPGAPAHEYDAAQIAGQILGSYGPYVHNKLYRRSIIEEHGIRFPPESQGAEDLFFNMNYLQHCGKGVFLETPLYYYTLAEGSITDTFRRSRTVSGQYMSLPRACRYAAKILQNISEAHAAAYRARAAMYYQTVLRKLRSPDESYVNEAIAYVRENRKYLLRHLWSLKYYLSAMILCRSYPLWCTVFRNSPTTSERGD